MIIRRPKEGISTTHQAAVFILDNGGKARKKELKRYLGDSASLNNSILYLRQRGLIEHVGYATYALTEDGRKYAGKVLESIPDKAIETAKEAPEEDGTKKEQLVPTTTSYVDWQREYIKLANKQADLLGAALESFIRSNNASDNTH